jgi:hypothetical protein
MEWAGPACRPRRHARCARNAAAANVAKHEASAAKHEANVMDHVAGPATMIAAKALARCAVTMIAAVPGPMDLARCAAAHASAAKVATGVSWTDARWTGAT